MIALDFSFGQVNISPDTAHSAPANNQGVAVDENDAHAFAFTHLLRFTPHLRGAGA